MITEKDKMDLHFKLQDEDFCMSKITEVAEKLRVNESTLSLSDCVNQAIVLLAYPYYNKDILSKEELVMIYDDLITKYSQYINVH